MAPTWAWPPPASSFTGPPREDRPAPLRDLDPTCRLCGWRTLAEVVDGVRDRVRAETGAEPLIATETWTVPGELAFYCRGNPRVYTFGTVIADRHSQYDVWRPNPVADGEHFHGRTFVYVSLLGPTPPWLASAFDSVEDLAVVSHREQGHVITLWVIRACRGFRGFPVGASGARF